MNINPTTGKMISLREVRSLHPNMSIGPNTDISSLGYPVLEPVAQPTPAEGQIVRKGDPEEYEPEKWRETWIVEAQDIAPLKEQKHRERISALEDAREAGFTHSGSTVASDFKSQLLIQGVVQLAQMALADGSPEVLAQFSTSLGEGWRAVDGTIVATDAMGIIGMAQSLAAHIATCDGVSQAHKAAIDAATTVAELNAIDVTAGY